MKLKTRQLATEYIRSCGIPIAANGLNNLASRGLGPRYSTVLGRAVYRQEDLDHWISTEIARPPLTNRRRAARDAATRCLLSGMLLILTPDHHGALAAVEDVRAQHALEETTHGSIRLVVRAAS